MHNSYLKRATADLSSRVSTLIVNSQTVPIRNVSQDEQTVIVLTESLSGIQNMTSIQLLDEQGNLVLERTTNIWIPADQAVELRFEMSAKGDE